MSGRKLQRKFFISFRRSSLTPGLDTPTYGGFFEFDLEKERKISLRTLVSWVAFVSFLQLHVHSLTELKMYTTVQIDRSAVESFGGGGRVCIMARVYPVSLVDDDHQPHMYAFNNGSATVRVPHLRAWSMRTAQVSV